jgi:hypothetical protein
MSRARRVYSPRVAAVLTDSNGTPRTLDGAAVEAIREDWIVEDRWWTGRPLHRRYFELVLADGRSVTVFRDVRTGRWHRQPS